MPSEKDGNSSLSSRPYRLGILGTLVWDRIVDADDGSVLVEDWGGISYSLEGLSAALPPDWVLVPFLKLGADLSEQALGYLHTIPKAEFGSGVQVVPFGNHRVELRYRNQERVSERLGGRPLPWSWEDLAPLLVGVDALYLNFITGFELEVETALRLKGAFPGPLYADLHSLFLGISEEGHRIPRRLPTRGEWVTAFDAIQMNEEEFSLLGEPGEDPRRLASEALGPDLRLISVTMGKQGAAFLTAPGFIPDPRTWPGARTSASTEGGLQTLRIEPSMECYVRDPTGCGDVWGATFFARLLAGDPLREAMAFANRLAARNAAHRGARGLHLHLRGTSGT